MSRAMGRLTLDEAAERGAERMAPEARDALAGFLLSLREPDGGFRGRAPGSDPWYTLFALDGLLALGRREEALASRPYLRRGALTCRSGVHLACLLRARLRLGGLPALGLRWLIRCGFPWVCARTLAPYAALLGASVLESAGGNAGRWLRGWTGGEHRTPDGGVSNARSASVGLTAATAAAVALLAAQGRDPEGLADWLLAREAEEGGFVAAPGVREPDLLSTAVSLFALACAGRPQSPGRIAGWVDLLWDGRAFQACASDPAVDAEYALYGLVALGSMARP